MNHFDVAIIGAGPAGSAAAISLARRGYSVALMDKEQFPREKLCGDFINPSNWPILDELGVRGELLLRAHETVTAFRLTSYRGGDVETPMPSINGAPTFGLGLRRFYFDQIMLNKAEGEGVTTFQASRVKRLQRQPAGWRIEFSRRESVEDLQATILIGADGRNSWVAHHLGMARGMEHRRRAVGFQLRLKCRTGLNGKVEIHLFAGGYAGLLGLGDGTINLCLAAEKRRLSDRDPLDSLIESQLPGNPYLKEILQQSERIGEARSTYPVYFPPRRAYDDGILLIGDAARVNEPVTGEGVYFALRSGLIAAATIDEAFRRQDFSARPLSAYARRCEREFRLRRSLNVLIRFLMYRPALATAFIRMSGNRGGMLESLVHALCMPATAA